MVILPNGTSIPIKFKYELDPKYCDKCNSLGNMQDMCGVKVGRKRREPKGPASTSQDRTYPVPGHQELKENLDLGEKQNDIIDSPAEEPQTLGKQDHIPQPLNTEQKNQSLGCNKYLSDDDAYGKYYNSEPNVHVTDTDNIRNTDLEDNLSCEEWQTVIKKKRFNTKRGKAKAIFFDTPLFRQPLTRSKTLLLKRNVDGVWLPETALFDS